jgi:hypothetical protein
MKATIKTELVENQKSHHKGSEEVVTRIEVYSSLYEENHVYQNTVLDTDYAQWQKEYLLEIFKGFNPTKKQR